VLEDRERVESLRPFMAAQSKSFTQDSEAVGGVLVPLSVEQSNFESLNL